MTNTQKGCHHYKSMDTQEPIGHDQDGKCIDCGAEILLRDTPPESRGVEEEIDRRVALYGMAYKGILPDDTIKRSQEHWKNELLDFAQFFTTHRTQLLQEREREIVEIITPTIPDGMMTTGNCLHGSIDGLCGKCAQDKLLKIELLLTNPNKD